MWDNILNFGIDDEQGPTDTVKRSRNESNKSIIAEYTRLTGLIGRIASQAFEEFGQVESVKIIKDRYTGESRGFAFVEMPTKAEALSAIDGLNGKEFQESTIVVSEARPRSEGRSRGEHRRSW